MTRKAAARLFEPEQGRGPVARVRRGFDVTVGALRAGGRLEPVDADLVALGRTLADAIDATHVDPDGSPFTVARCAAELRAVSVALKGGAIGDDLDDLTTALFGTVPDRPQP